MLTAATLADFALLTPKCHMTWTRLVGGRLKSDIRYSIGVVYNTFPVPPEYHTPETQSMLESLAQAVLETRGRYPESTLAHLYDPDLTPPDLRKAHQQLDRAVDRLYHPRGYKTEPQRLRTSWTYTKKRFTAGDIRHHQHSPRKTVCRLAGQAADAVLDLVDWDAEPALKDSWRREASCSTSPEKVIAVLCGVVDGRLI